MTQSKPGSDPDEQWQEEWRRRRLFPGEQSIPMPDLELQARVGPAPAFHDIALTTMGRMNIAGLRPDHDVLDVGCGVGRMARYLCDYLGRDARYEGFDIMEEMIQWCQQQITPLFPNFRFTYTPLFNSSYKPDTSLPTAASFKFPYTDQSFDFVFAHSVFTHLQPNDTENYMREVQRVLRPGGISYLTWFLFEDDLLSSPKSMVTEMHLDSSGNFAVHNPDMPDNAVAYRESFVREIYASSQLAVMEPIHFGFERMQDAIVAVK